MTDKELLLKAICGYLPYALQVKSPHLNDPDYATGIDTETGKLQVLYNGYTDDIEKFKPYLRPMSSMAEEEKKEYEHIATGIEIENGVRIPNVNQIEWLNAYHFDFRGLIEKNLALPAPDGMYETK